MNGDIEEHSSVVNYVSKPYKRRKTTNSEKEVIDLTKESYYNQDNINSKTMENNKIDNLIISETNTISTGKMSPFTKMLINEPDPLSEDKPILIEGKFDNISLDSSPLRAVSPLTLPCTPSDCSSFSFLELNDKRVSSPLCTSGSYSKGVSIYAEANSKSKKCKPLLEIPKKHLDEIMRTSLTEHYSYLFSISEDTQTSPDDKPEVKLKEFVKDYLLQKKYKDTSNPKPKMKKTPTLEELRQAKKKKRKGTTESAASSPTQVSKLPKDYLNSYTRRDNESDGSEFDIKEHISDIKEHISVHEDSDSDFDDVEIIEPSTEEAVAPDSAVASLKEAYDAVHRKDASFSERGPKHPYQHTFQRPVVRTAVDLREAPPTMLPHKSHHEGVYSYVTKEHDYCHYYNRPKHVDWKIYKHVPPKSRGSMTPSPLSQSNKMLLNVLPRPGYVMSEPWLFVPSVEDLRRDSEEYEQALGFETVLKHMLKKDMDPKLHYVECAKCEIDFSCEWFTFMSKRLCKTCYKEEVKSRNSIIYLTNLSNLTRKAHDKGKTGNN